MDYLKDVVFIGSLWAHIVVFGLILSVAFEDQFDMIWPILPGLAWLPFWNKIWADFRPTSNSLGGHPSRSS